MSKTTNENILQPFLKNLWSDLEKGVLFEEEWLNDWIAQCKKLRTTYISTVLSETKQMEIYRSLMHMTNNRLGILNQDESFLAFLLMKAND